MQGQGFFSKVGTSLSSKSPEKAVSRDCVNGKIFDHGGKVNL